MLVRSLQGSRVKGEPLDGNVRNNREQLGLSIPAATQIYRSCWSYIWKLDIYNLHIQFSILRTSMHSTGTHICGEYILLRACITNKHVLPTTLHFSTLLCFKGGANTELMDSVFPLIVKWPINKPFRKGVNRCEELDSWLLFDTFFGFGLMAKTAQIMLLIGKGRVPEVHDFIYSNDSYFHRIHGTGIIYLHLP